MAEPTLEVFSWLRNLPLAPEYHPTLQEFQDPIAYIFKIEKEASQYGICKIVPPVPPPPKKSTVTNLTRSLAARSSGAPTFTTRQQQIGFCPRKPCPVRKPVWQSGEMYTYHEFEAKARAFERNYLRKFGKKNSSPSALEIETLYWKAAVDKPFSVEYANDMPGSAFGPLVSKKAGEGTPLNVGETNWNMRGVSRSVTSLLRFMKEEIPGVTSPMVYLAMLFSWFAWHVEDHDLHSLNYLHTGAAKTWYGIPRDAAVAFEEVVRVQGYGEEVNPLVTFAILGEKTTVISPEVLVGAGVPCCRLVQNAGEFVVTFPRAYHSGFSHGFNCGEAANIATPEWLRFAKDAAIRRASINYSPMVSHFQLLYDLALALCSRVPNGINSGPRSSRLKDKKKGEGESMIKEQFVQDVKQNNELLHVLGKGSPVVLLPHNSSDVSVCSNLGSIGSHMSQNLSNPDEDTNSPVSLISDNIMADRNRGINPLKRSYTMSAKVASLYEIKKAFLNGKGGLQTADQETNNRLIGERKDLLGDMLSDQRLFSCVTCGILAFSCAAIVQPREPAARYLMSAECSFFNDWTVNSGGPLERLNVTGSNRSSSGQKTFAWAEKRGFANDIYDFPVQAQIQSPNESEQMALGAESQRGTSALGLIGLNYGDSSDSEDAHDEHEHDGSQPDDDNSLRASPSEKNCHAEYFESPSNISHQSSDFIVAVETNNVRPGDSEGAYGKLKSLNVKASSSTPILPADEDSSGPHVFCLEHALEVEQQLGPIGGVDIFLLCHPDYPKVESEAKLVAAELGIDNLWKEITFRDATREDEERIKSALDREDAIPRSSDWAVKLGINLFYSSSLCWSSLYSKQMPYNSVIYNAFGRNSPSSGSPMRHNDCEGKKASRQRNSVAGRWCGRVWKSNQVHRFLAWKDPEEAEEEVEEMRTFPASVTKVEATPVIKYERKRKTGGSSRLSKRNKSFGKEEEVEVSNDSFIDTSKKLKRPGKGIPAKTSLKREAMASEDEADDLGSPYPGPLKRKWAKRVDGDFHGNSNDSLEGDYEKPSSRRVYRAKPAEFTPVEDVNSDASLSGDSQHEMRMLKGKLVRHVDEEEEKYDDENDDDVSNGSDRLKKSLSMRKRGTYGSENDSIGGDKSPPLPRILRNKRKKQQVVQNMLREISHHVVKQGNPHPMKGRISLPVKRRTPRVSKEVIPHPMRQETQLRSGKEKPAVEEETEGGPCTRFRRRASKPTKETEARAKGTNKQTTTSSKKDEKPKNISWSGAAKTRNNEMEYSCNVEGCNMSFGSKQELVLHKKNICPVKGCGKKFFSHKYLMQHRRVHMDDRPLKCPWKGCKMTFKWAWARTEHIRVHTGVRPYVCGEPGCGQTFRFVSDFSRHKRKTGHSTKVKGVKH